MGETARNFEAMSASAEEPVPSSAERGPEKRPRAEKMPESAEQDIVRTQREALERIGLDTAAALASSEELHDAAAAEEIRRSDEVSRKAVAEAGERARAKTVPQMPMEVSPDGAGVEIADDTSEGKTPEAEPGLDVELDLGDDEDPDRALADAEQDVADAEDDAAREDAERRLEAAKLLKERQEREQAVRQMTEQSDALKEQLEALLNMTPANDIRQLPPELQTQAVAYRKKISSLDAETASAKARIGGIVLALVGLERVAASAKARRLAEGPRQEPMSRVTERKAVVAKERPKSLEAGRPSSPETPKKNKKPHAMKRFAKGVGGVAAVGVGAGLFSVSGLFGGIARFFEKIGKPGALKRAATWVVTAPERLVDWLTEKVTGETTKTKKEES
ncbi:hypothetical protein L0Y59_05380 [Candidatus Uhrbacteria bacterium]|nr:hypothetical protein [Candidatus Uhrbacteria bacterium]